MPDWQLATDRLFLRRVTLDDADLLLAVWTDPAFIKNVGDRGVRTIEEAKEAMKAGALKLYADYGYGPYAMVRKDDGARMGICGLFKRDNLDFPDIGFGVLPEFCGKGYAGEVIGDYAGLSRRHPAAALGMLIFMLALAGIPPTAGFMGKLYLFAAAVQGGYVILTLIAVVMSAVSLFYYFRIVVQMYLRDGEEEDAAPAELLRDRWTEVAIAVCVAVTLIVGIYPAPLVGWAKSAVSALGLM